MSALPQPSLKSDFTDPSEQLSEAQRMETIGRLVSGVAHDFNNLLTGIVLCSDLLIAGLEKSSRLRHYAEEIRTASAQGAGMIQNLLAIARQRALAPTLLSLNDVTLSMRSLLTRLIGESVELRIDLAADLKPVIIDPAEAQEIILNLVLNARDAIPDGGQIGLDTRNGLTHGAEQNSAAFIALTVSDTGTGMDAETQARVFEPFFTTKAAGKGTGLGLATVHRIVKQRGGTVQIESEPRKGTRVVIRLPATDSNQQSLNPNGRNSL